MIPAPGNLPGAFSLSFSRISGQLSPRLEWPSCLSNGPQPPHLSELSFGSLLCQTFHLLSPKPYTGAPGQVCDLFHQNLITSPPHLKSFNCHFCLYSPVFIALWNLALACFSTQGSTVPTLEPHSPAEPLCHTRCGFGQLLPFCEPHLPPRIVEMIARVVV